MGVFSSNLVFFCRGSGLGLFLFQKKIILGVPHFWLPIHEKPQAKKSEKSFGLELDAGDAWVSRDVDHFGIGFVLYIYGCFQK